MQTKRHYFGQEIAEPAVKWFNEQSDGPRTPLGTLVRLLGEFDYKPRSLKAINSLLRRYAAVPTMDLDRPRNSWKMSPIPKGKKISAAELDAFFGVMDLFAEELLHRLRVCDKPGCAKVFFARFDHQKFHSLKCQQDVFQGDPKSREKRRRYMRRYYRAEKKRGS
jgi:predicted RNA-binding Zn ribbon-like protein